MEVAGLLPVHTTYHRHTCKILYSTMLIVDSVARDASLSLVRPQAGPAPELWAANEELLKYTNNG